MPKRWTEFEQSETPQIFFFFNHKWISNFGWWRSNMAILVPTHGLFSSFLGRLQDPSHEACVSLHQAELAWPNGTPLLRPMTFTVPLPVQGQQRAHLTVVLGAVGTGKSGLLQEKKTRWIWWWNRTETFQIQLFHFFGTIGIWWASPTSILFRTFFGWKNPSSMNIQNVYRNGEALIGDLHPISGSLKTSGSMAYTPQVAWIRNATLKENIIFNSRSLS